MSARLSAAWKRNVVRMSTIDIPSVMNRVMRDHGISQQDMADAAGVTTKSIGRWATGESNPPVRKVSRALQRLGVDPRVYGLRPAPDVGTVSSLESTMAPAWAVQQFEQLQSQLKDMHLMLVRIERQSRKGA